MLADDIQDFGKLVLAIYDKDINAIVRIIKRYSKTSVKNEEAFKYEVNEIINDYYYRSLNELDFETIISRFKDLIFNYNITIPAHLFLLLKTLSQVESDCRMVYPELNIFDILNTYAKKYTARKLKPKTGIKDLYYLLSDFSLFIRKFPGDAAEIMSTIKEGKLNVRFEHHRLDRFVNAIQTSSNRLTFGLILAAMIIGSSMVILADMPPHWNGISILGLIGHLSALIISVFFVFSIFRKS